MRSLHNRLLLLVTIILANGAASAGAREAAGPAKALYHRVAPSLVVVQYTYAGEGTRREIAGTGIVVRDDGLVMASMALTPPQLPDEHMKDFKIIIPGDDQEEIDAVFQGRDERSNMIFVKPASPTVSSTSGTTTPTTGETGNRPRAWTALKFEDLPIEVGQQVASVALMPEDAGYRPYYSRAMVSAVLRGPVPMVLVDGAGLGAIGAPVFDEAGRAIGLVEMQEDHTPLLNDPRREYAGMPMPTRVFVPARDFLISINDPPAGSPLTLPWAGVSQLTGLPKEVAEYYSLKGQPAVQVGDVIPGMAADKAGLKAGEVIVKFNGKPLERGDQPDETWQIMTRKIQRLKPGEKITFSVLSSRDQPPRDVTLTLGERPKPPSRAERFFAEDLGFAVRELVFEDTYERRLAHDATGVIVAYLKQGAGAQTARLSMNDMITQLNGQPVDSLADFKTRLQAFRKDRPREAVVLEVLRGANTTVIRIEPPQ